MIDKEINFGEKVEHFIVMLLVMKLIYLIAQSIYMGDVAYFFKGFLFTLLLFAGIFFIISRMFERAGIASGESSIIGDKYFDALANRYEKLTNEYIEKKQYRKASYIQLKLLKNPYRAAGILKEGKLYNEAAIVFLKKCHNKEEAAECYELARSYNKAINLYKELDENEKIGDIYAKINDKKNAHTYYQMVIDDYVENDSYVKASLIYRKKMGDITSSRNLLLKGWRENLDPIRCLNNYFVQFENEKELEEKIHQVYKDDVNSNNELNFLDVIEIEYKKGNNSQDSIQNMAYKIISKNADKNYIVSVLSHFVKEDRHVTKDIIKHRLKNK
ncbi:MAG: hypothetical protein JXR05_02010 [Flavobacteriaceae bacterium]